MGEVSAIEVSDVVKLLTKLGIIELHDVVIRAKKVVIRPARRREG